MLKGPIVTEKSTKLASLGLYTFKVSGDVPKKAIARLISDKFKVDVVSVKTINVKGKTKVQKKVRKSFKMPSYKKAIVKLKKGQKLAIFETLGKTEEATVTTADSGQVTLKERKGILGRTKVRIEKGVGTAPTTQRKVIPT